jgi:Domain of unknown function (DUF4145)
VVIEAEIGDQYGMKGVLWWPTEHLGDLERVAGVPPEIVESYSEGVRCLGVQSPNAAAVMFRNAIAQIVENKGSEAAKKKNTLNARIKQMVQDRTLSGRTSGTGLTTFALPAMPEPMGRNGIRLPWSRPRS